MLMDETGNGVIESRFSISQTAQTMESAGQLSSCNMLDDDQEGKGKKVDAFNDFRMHSRGSILLNSRRPTTITLDGFELLKQLGRGTFGKVFLAKLKATGDLYAIKVIRKDVLLEYDQVQSTLLEKDVMLAADHPFLNGMEFLFTSETRLYFVMPFVQGGELYKVMLD